MGYRTTLIINNDNLDLLTSDPDITNKIKTAILGGNNGNLGPLGCVVEQAHANMTKLVVLGHNGSFSIKELSMMNTRCVNVEDSDLLILELLRQAADNLGYKLIKKSTK